MEASASTELVPEYPDLLEALATQRGVPREVKRIARRVKKVSGRPTKLNVTTAIRIIHHVLQGNYIKTACAEAGITEMTLRNWKARAQELVDDPECDVMALPPEERVFVDFFALLKVAEAGAEQALLKRALRGDKGWQAAMTVLERRHPEYWGRSEKRIHEGSEERPIVFSLESPTERQQRVAGVLQEAGVLEGTATERAELGAGEGS